MKNEPKEDTNKSLDQDFLYNSFNKPTFFVSNNFQSTQRVREIERKLQYVIEKQKILELRTIHLKAITSHLAFTMGIPEKCMKPVQIKQ